MNSRKLIPMLFSTDMAQANMAMVKTETRRVVKPQPIVSDIPITQNDTWGFVQKKQVSSNPDRFEVLQNWKCPYGHPGDIIWMRENFTTDTHDGGKYNYYAGNKQVKHNTVYRMFTKWKPSIHMPLEACRYFAVIEEIKCERLQDITNAGAMAEGIRPIDGETEAWPDFMDNNGSYVTARGSYLSLWDKINGEGAAAQNPWVWVVKYRRIGAAELAAYRDEILASYNDYDKRDTINAAMQSCIKRMPLAVGGAK